jgi:PAS domain-containing protein
MFFWGLLAHGLPVFPSLVFCAIEVGTLTIGAWIATIHQRDVDNPAAAALLILGAIVAASLGGLLAVAFWAWQRPLADGAIEWRAWSFSTVVGILLVVPLVTALRTFRVRRSGGLTMPHFLGGLVAFLIFTAAAFLVFSFDASAHFGTLAPTLAYLPMPFLLVTAFLWGPAGGALATLLGMLFIVARTAAGGGPFAIAEAFPGEAVIEVQGFVAVWTAVLLFMRALAAGRREALVQQQEWRLRYERALDAVGVASVEYDAITGLATWGADASRTLGSGIAGVGSIDEWLDRIDSSERALVLSAWKSVASGERASSEQDYGYHLADGRIVRIHERLASIRGGDDRVEKVAALVRLASPAGATHG